VGGGRCLSLFLTLLHLCLESRAQHSQSLTHVLVTMAPQVFAQLPDGLGTERR
jgi:hypothetical protein